MENLNAAPVGPEENTNTPNASAEGSPEQANSPEAEIIKQQDIGNKTMGAADVTQDEIIDRSGAQGIQTFIDSHGVVHPTAEACREAEEGYK